MTAPFGRFAPSPRQEFFRRLAKRLPSNGFGRKAASLLLGPAGGRSRRPYDVAVFGAQRARLHPYDNICEKRVFLAPQLWDPCERAALAEAIAAHADESFAFLDVGANAGLYTLFVRSECARRGLRLRGLAVEPDPEMRRRLRFNLAVSGAGGDVEIADCAAGAAAGEAKFAPNRRSRGLGRLDPEGEFEVAVRPLADIVADAGWRGIDAMKIDIEGGEHAVLAAFFAAAPIARWPRLLLLETSHEGPARAATALCRSNGYEVRLQTKMNAVLARR